MMRARRTLSVADREQTRYKYVSILFAYHLSNETGMKAQVIKGPEANVLLCDALGQGCSQDAFPALGRSVRRGGC
jgi:hypothetical protein